MRHSPDGDFHVRMYMRCKMSYYIGHFTDHMTKFNILFPLKDKSAAEIARLIEEQGLPHIFHSDNGREFVNQLLHSLLDQWSSNNITFFNGHPCHSQSQGLVDPGKNRCNQVWGRLWGRTIFPMGFMASKDYCVFMLNIMFNMNTQWHATTKEMPFKLVFGQILWSALIPGASKHVVNWQGHEQCDQH